LLLQGKAAMTVPAAPVEGSTEDEAIGARRGADRPQGLQPWIGDR
jgi:hypothetical protein